MTSFFDQFLKLFDLNPKAGKFLAIGLLVLTAAALVISWGLALDALINTGLVIAGFSLFVFILMNLSGVLVKFLSWSLTVLFTLWLVAMILQIVSGGRMPWASVQCLIYPLSNSCTVLQIADSEPGTFEKTANDPADGDANVDRDPDADPVPDGNPDVDGNPSADALIAPPATQDSVLVNFKDQIDHVEIYFAGSIKSSLVEDFAQVLIDDGWPADKDRNTGVVRTGEALGFNEVRYYHPDDKEAAKELTAILSENNPSGKPVGLRNLSNTELSRPINTGVLQIWISN